MRAVGYFAGIVRARGNSLVLETLCLKELLQSLKSVVGALRIGFEAESQDLHLSGALRRPSGIVVRRA